ncbi:MAG: hypothetical protein M3R72_00090, partial [Bacteroidota bacterium]|nr:hypothetical protein [Bacteroidota bacterium]
MDSQHATVVGREDAESNNFTVLGHIKNEGAGNNSDEKKANNSEKTLQHKFFKEITALMQNAEEVYVTGTGQEQEQFISYLSETPQFKNTSAKESTSNKMDDAKLVAYIT